MTCLHGRYRPSLAQVAASQLTPLCLGSWCRIRHGCHHQKNHLPCLSSSMMALSFKTPSQLQHLQHLSCATPADSSRHVENATWQSGEDTGDCMLGWSLNEQQPGSAVQQRRVTAGQLSPGRQQQQPATDAGSSKPQHRCTQQQHEQQKQQRPNKRQPTQQHGYVGQQAGPTRTPGRLASAASNSNHSSNHRSTQQAQQTLPQQQTMTDDDYAAAQQRVRQLLISADVNNPQAAADALPDTVNDVVIALQVLATASKPSGLSIIKQYEAATQLLAGAIVHKFKQMMLRRALPSLTQRQQQQQRQQHSDLQLQQQPLCQQADAAVTGFYSHKGSIAAAAAVHSVGAAANQKSLAAAFAALPPTKLAAITFSLGVLRHYDTELVNALESASLQVLLCSSTSRRHNTSAPGHGSAEQKLAGKQDRHQQSRQGQQQQQQLLQALQRKPPGFNANQLGQLAQGFVYLDQQLSPTWQATFLRACKQQLQYMKGPQLASLAVFLVHYRQYWQCTDGSASSTVSLVPNRAGSTDITSCTVNQFGSSSVVGQFSSSTVAPAGASSLDMQWVEAYLHTVGQQAAALKPQQLVQVLQAATGLYQECLQQQQQQDEGSERAASNSISRIKSAAAGRVFEGVPMSMAAAALSAEKPRLGLRNHTSGSPGGSSSSSRVSSSSSSGSSSWLPPLLSAFQQQLPDLKMAQLGDGLTALLPLTVRPWPQELQQQVLLQLQVLMPAAAGCEIVTALEAVAALAGDSGTGSAAVSRLPADDALCDAVLQRLHALLPTLSPPDLARVVKNLALLRVKPYRAWLYELFARLRVEARFMGGHEVLATIEGLALVRVQLDPEVLHLFVIGVQRWMGVLGSEELRRLVAALQQMYPGVLPGRTVAQLVEELERRATLLELQMPKEKALWAA